MTADLASADPETLRAAVEGADAVLSALGPLAGRRRGDLAGHPGRHPGHGLGRGPPDLVVSAAPIGTVASPARPHPPRRDPGDGFIVRNLAFPVVRAVLRDNYADLARMEDVLRDSGLDWTAVRPPRLTSKPATGRYRTALGRNVRHGLLISRADVAHYLLRAVTEPATYRQTIGLAY